MTNNITDIVNSIVRYLGKVSVTCNGVWKDNIAYDRLSVVYTDYASYISKKAVPAGTPVSNANYWQIISNLQDEIKIDYDTFKSEILKDIAELNKRQSSGRITVDTMDDFEKLTIVEVNAGAEVYVLNSKKTYIIDEIDTQNNKEYHELVYNSLSTAAYTEVPKEERLMERIKILKDYVVEYGDKITTFPITLVQAILDLDSGKNLSSLLSMFNYLVLPWNGDFASTVNEVPDIMRNLGTLVTYKDSDGFIWTKRYKLSDFSKSNWENINNWEGWDLQAAEEEIIKVIEKIFTNIDDYPSVKNLVVNSITTAVEDIFSSDLATYPDLYNAIKNQVNTSVNNIFANLDSYPNIKNIINTNVLNQVNYIFNHISDYSILKTLLETCVRNIFTNIDDYPNIKTIIVNKVAEIAPGIINTIFTNINSYPTLKNNIDLGVYSRVDYVFKHLDDYPDLKKLIQDAATADGSKYILKTDKGAANGVAPLGADSKVPAQYLPSYVDDVVDYTNIITVNDVNAILNNNTYSNKIYIVASNNATYNNKIIDFGNNTSTNDWVIEDLVTDKLYINTSSGNVYRWSGTTLAKIGPADLVLGETTGTAFDGGKGKVIQTKVNSLPATLLEANGASVEATATGANLHFQMQEFVTAEGVYTGDDKYVALPVATESAAGIMSAKDKKKLNTIEEPIVVADAESVTNVVINAFSKFKYGKLVPIYIEASSDIYDNLPAVMDEGFAKEESTICGYAQCVYDGGDYFHVGLDLLIYPSSGSRPKYRAQLIINNSKDLTDNSITPIGSYAAPIPGFTKITSLAGQTDYSLVAGSTGIINFNTDVNPNTTMFIEAEVRSSAAISAVIRAICIPVSFFNPKQGATLMDLHTRTLASGTNIAQIKLNVASVVTGANGVQGLNCVVTSNNLTNTSDILRIKAVYANI